ncbi:hypothetical protein NDU88_007203 [Pleurodeles waltl]|uniref:Uncharacterized protein n=1 Tax=Pleurodeles waltl TaxID=8319 RepID=A0AAV7SRM6_PLEWA|nr:hypothetical protein NDU88_007203 [Pleurodeles waltl]
MLSGRRGSPATPTVLGVQGGRRRVSSARPTLYSRSLTCALSSVPPNPRGEQSPLVGAGERGVGRSTPPPVAAAVRVKGGAPFTAGLRELDYDAASDNGVDGEMRDDDGVGRKQLVGPGGDSQEAGVGVL